MTVLGPRALNRALLERQSLIRREQRSAISVVEQLVGLHAQIPTNPYLGLWSRIEGFRPEELATPISDRRLVRVALMRSTIHLVTPDDCMALRGLVQPVLDRDLYKNSTHGRAVQDLDLDAVVAEGRRLLDEQPRTPSDLGKLLQERWPDRRPDSLAYAVRNLVPLVQVPPRGLWGKAGRPTHATAEHWLGRPQAAPAGAAETILRYLGAFGPATVNDIQAWCGLTRLGEVVEPMRARLRVFRDESGRELFDLPDAPLPDQETPIAPRFLTEFDNVFLSHADRARIIPGGLSFAEFSKKFGFFMTARGGVHRGNLLLDGVLNGVWRIDKARRDYTLVVEPFTRLSTADAAALEAEGGALLAFAVDQADQLRIEITRP